VAEITVNLPQGAYGIHIMPGAIQRIGQLMRNLGMQGMALVVSDENVGALYGAAVLHSLTECGCKAELICVPPGEGSKSLGVAMELYTKAVTMGLDRRSPVIALGGGVVGDLAGFVAATYLRGVPFIQIPTTLLAMVDSSVGGKVAVNHELGKNLIGAFYQPRLVVADLDVLSTLPERELIAGLAEVIKYGAIHDTDFFNYLNRNCAALMKKEEGVLTEVISRCCRSKAWVVEQDEKENNLRMILNFGHTIGHAIEAETDYTGYRHGEAVAVGMYAASLISRELGLCTSQTVEAMREIIQRFSLPLTARECSPERLMTFLKRDKKSVDNVVQWVLIQAPGEVVIERGVNEAVLRSVLEQIT